MTKRNRKRITNAKPSWSELKEQCYQNFSQRIAELHDTELIVIQKTVVQILSGIESGMYVKDVFNVLQQIGPIVSRGNMLLGCQSIVRDVDHYRSRVGAADRPIEPDPDIGNTFPYLRYYTVGNGTPGTNMVKESHAKLHRIIVHRDDEFWKYHTPPWEDGCRCMCSPLTKGQVEREGLPVRNLEYVRNVLGVEVGPEEFHLGNMDIESSRKIFKARFECAIYKAMLAYVDNPLKQLLDGAVSSEQTRQVSCESVDRWKSLNAELKTTDSPVTALATAEDKLTTWKEQLEFVEMRMSEKKL